MAIIKDNKKFERKKTQERPLDVNRNLKKNKDFDLDSKTIKEKESSE